MKCFIYHRWEYFNSVNESGWGIGYRICSDCGKKRRWDPIYESYRIKSPLTKEEEREFKLKQLLK